MGYSFIYFNRQKTLKRDWSFDLLNIPGIQQNYYPGEQDILYFINKNMEIGKVPI